MKRQQIVIQNTSSVSKHAQWIFSTQLRLINSHQIWTWRVKTSEKTEGFLSRSSVKGSVLCTRQKIDGVWGRCPDNMDIIYHFPNLLHSESASMKDREKMTECKLRAVMGSGLGGVGGGGYYYMCFALIVFIYRWPSGLRDERLAIKRGGERSHTQRNNIYPSGNEE